MRSLLWPLGQPAPAHTASLSDAAMRDLEVDRLVDSLSEERPDRRLAVSLLLRRLPRDAATVRWRVGASTDLLASPSLCDGLSNALRALRLLVAHRPTLFSREVPRAARIGARVVELAAYVEAVSTLRSALSAPAVRSPALLAVRADAEAAADTAAFRSLAEELPRWRRELDQVRRVTVAINVSPSLQPESAAIVGFSDSPAAAEDTALAGLLGAEQGARGLARLFRNRPVDWQATDRRLVADLQALLEAVAAPVEQALHTYRRVGTQDVAHLEEELVLLLGGARLGRRWRGWGLPCCLAEVAEESGTEVADAFHPVLAAGLARPGDIVRNRVVFGDEGSVWVLTGPNRGGKTTYLRTAAMVQILGQCGLPVPAAAARLTPVDAIHTHFPAVEAEQPGRGRLDEEAARLARIFDTASARSLVLLNETLAGTSAPEGVALGLDVLRGFRVLGCDVVYATHLHELAKRCGEVNESIAGPGRVDSLTVEVACEENHGQAVRRPTYRIGPGQPEGASWFAAQIAHQHGISLPQILERLRSRGVPSEP